MAQGFNRWREVAAQLAAEKEAKLTFEKRLREEFNIIVADDGALINKEPLVKEILGKVRPDSKKGSQLGDALATAAA